MCKNDSLFPSHRKEIWEFSWRSEVGSWVAWRPQWLNSHLLLLCVSLGKRQMVCQEKEDHVEMNICNTGSEAALYKAGGLEWNPNTYIKREGIGELPHDEAWHLTSQPAWGTVICYFLTHTESSIFPKENELFLFRERHYFRSLHWVKNKETSEKVTHDDLRGLSDFLIHSNTDGFFFFFLISKG